MALQASAESEAAGQFIQRRELYNVLGLRRHIFTFAVTGDVGVEAYCAIASRAVVVPETIF